MHDKLNPLTGGRINEGLPDLDIPLLPAYKRIASSGGEVMVVNRMKKTTLSDVAERAGVSRTTASYILSKTRGGFAKETIERVSNAAIELGFRPNPIAQSLRTGRTSLLGLLVTADIQSSRQGVHQVNMGVALEASIHHRDVVQVLISSDAGPEISRLCELLDTGLLEGLILDAPRKRDVLPWLQGRGAAFVVIGNPGMNGVYSVDVDNVGIGRTAARHLIDLGHKHLVYITPSDDSTCSNNRIEGFITTCAETNIASENTIVIRADDSMAGGYQVAKELLRSGSFFTGICASDDSVAYGAASALAEAGLAVPGDVSIVGCNNDHQAGIDQNFLTTISVDFSKLGSLAARKLVALLEDKPINQRDIIGFSLIERKSTGPVNKTRQGLHSPIRN